PPGPTLFPYTTLFRSSINANHGTLDRLALQPVSCATADFQHTLALGRAKEGAQGGGDTAVIVFNVSTIVLGGDVVVACAPHKLRSEEHTSELQSQSNL